MIRSLLSQLYIWAKVIGYSLMLFYWVLNPTPITQKLGNLCLIIFQIFLNKFIEFVILSYFRNRRTKKLRKIASKMGLEFYKTDKNNILMPMLEGLPFFKDRRPRTKNLLYDILNTLQMMLLFLFSVGEKVKLKNILICKEKQKDTFWAIFDFNKESFGILNSEEEISSPGLSSLRNESQTMIIFASEDLNLPEFSAIAKEKNIFHKIFSRIDEAYEESLNKRSKHVSQIFGTKINDFYQSEKNLCTAAKGYRLMCYQNKRLIKPKKIESFLSKGFQLLELFKATDSINVKRSLDYTKLQDLLKSSNWKEADQETNNLLLTAIGKKSWKDINAINATITVDLRDAVFLSPVLHDIDALWIEHSKGHFGFSVQKRIWLDVGSEVDYRNECLLANKVGWRVNGKWLHYSDLNFSLNAPQGHLPTTELSLKPLGWFYFFKHQLFKIPGYIGLVRQINLPACFIASRF